VRWISTVALQTNLRDIDGAGEGANDNEGVRTVSGRHERLRGAHTLGRGHACLGGGALRPRGGAHA
jgi:hypothetical protein